MTNVIEAPARVVDFESCQALGDLVSQFPKSLGLQSLNIDLPDAQPDLGALSGEIGSGYLPPAAIVIAAALRSQQVDASTGRDIVGATKRSLRLLTEAKPHTPFLSYDPGLSETTLVPEGSGVLTARPIGIDWDGRGLARLTLGVVGADSVVQSWEPAGGLAIGRGEVEALVEELYAQPHELELGPLCELDTNALRLMAHVATNAVTLQALNDSMRHISEPDLRYPAAHHAQVRSLLAAFRSIVPQAEHEVVSGRRVLAMLPAIEGLNSSLAHSIGARLASIAS